MITINLLPKDKRRAKIGSQPVAPLLAVIIFLALGLAVLTIYFNGQNKSYQKMISEFDKQISLAKAKTKDYEETENKLKQIQSLTQEIEEINYQATLVEKTLTEIKNNTPVDVQFTGLGVAKDSKSNINLTGKSLSLRAISRFRERFEELDWAESAALDAVTQADEGGYSFTVKVISKDLKAQP